MTLSDTFIGLPILHTFVMIFSLNDDYFTFIAPHQSLRFNYRRHQSGGVYPSLPHNNCDYTFIARH